MLSFTTAHNHTPQVFIISYPFQRECSYLDVEQALILQLSSMKSPIAHGYESGLDQGLCLLEPVWAYMSCPSVQ